MKKIFSLMIAILMLLALMAGCTSSDAPDGHRGGGPEETIPLDTTPVDPIPIEINTIVEDHDLTGDGQADTLQLLCVEPWEDLEWGTYGYHWQVLVNGEAAMEIETDWAISLETELYPVGQGRTYLAICQRLDANDDIADFALYLYDDGKLVEVCDFYCKDLHEKHIFHYDAQLLSVSAGKIVLRCSNQFNATAHLVWDMELVYQDGKWAPDGNVYPIVYDDDMEMKADGMTANQELTVYTDTDCAEAAYTVAKGGILMLDRLCIQDGEVYFHVTNADGAEGWLKDPEEVFATIDGEDLLGYFEEALFAG